MKKNKNTVNYLTGITVITFCSVALSAFGVTSPQAEALKQDLIRVPALEFPAKAAQLVSKTKTSEKDAVTAAVVVAGLDLHPTSAAALVGAIAKRNPGVASLAVVAAVTRQPKQFDAIIMAAVAAAPSQVRKIVFDVAKAEPTQYASLALAAYQAAPRAGKDILEALGLALPALSPLIAQATTQLGKSGSFSEIIDRTETMVVAAARAAKTTPERFLASTVGSTTTLALADGTPRPPPGGNGQGSLKPHKPNPGKARGHNYIEP